jgi:hypothetical protein
MLSNNNQRCGYTLRVTSQASFSKIVFDKYILPICQNSTILLHISGIFKYYIACLLSYFPQFLPELSS